MRERAPRSGGPPAMLLPGRDSIAVGRSAPARLRRFPGWGAEKIRESKQPGSAVARLRRPGVPGWPEAVFGHFQPGPPPGAAPHDKGAKLPLRMGRPDGDEAPIKGP